MSNKRSIWMCFMRKCLPAIMLALSVMFFIGCGSSGDDGVFLPRTASVGVFVDSPVAGLDYATESLAGITNTEGQFRYYQGQEVIFSIGDLPLGSAPGAALLTPLSITESATDASERIVHNKLILLQTLDTDGDLNNGIQITDAIREIVSGHAANIDFDQEPADFRTSLAGLMIALNDADVFTDLDPRPRSPRPAVAALEHFARATSQRVVVNTVYGQLRGYEASASVWQFLGVPYAKPPVNDLRWRPPQNPVAWTGVRDAIAWGDQAAQLPAYEAFGEGGMSEDCLYLNISAPKEASAAPVMVWFHGGGFSILTGNTKAFNNPTSLPTKGVVLVTVNHRLGALGYLAHPWLTAESGYGGSGNYGQMDLIAALEWVQENIAAFGGDPENVTIFGESGGGGKVQHLLASPQAAGLFHRAIIQSGMYPPTTKSLLTAEAGGLALQAELGVSSLAEMREISWMDIISKADTATVEIIPGSPPVSLAALIGPNVDNGHLPDTMKNIVEAGQHNDVPLISGMNKNDINDPATGMGIPLLIAWMPWLAENFTSTYAYVFDHVMTGWRAEGGIAYHGIELIYVFNYPLSAYTHHALGLTGLPPGPPPSLGWGVADIGVVNSMMTMWTNFAKTGNPSIAGTITWDSYTGSADNYLEIGQGGTLEMKAPLADAFD